MLAELSAAGASRVVDLGCGEGALLRALLRNPSFTEVLGVDVSARALAQAERRLGLERMPDSQRARLRLLQSSLTYRDERLTGYDAAVLMEVIEHLDPARLPSLESSIFGHARPGRPDRHHAECGIQRAVPATGRRRACGTRIIDSSGPEPNSPNGLRPSRLDGVTPCD